MPPMPVLTVCALAVTYNQIMAGNGGRNTAIMFGTEKTGMA